MKKTLKIFAILFIIPMIMSAQKLKPYTLGASSSSSISELKSQVKSALSSEGFDIIGEYKPANDNNRYLIIATSSELKSAVKKIGGFTGFGAALRVALTKEGETTIISYTTPEYWGNAYFQKNYSTVESTFKSAAVKLASAISKFGTAGGFFGSEKGLSPSSLQKYHYMMGMPYFKDNITLKEFSSFEEATKTIENNLASNSSLKKVYALKIPGRNIKVYGVGLGGSKGESSFLPTIDKKTPKNTAFLPYELLIVDNKAYMLHGRYRIALAFPDLSMGTFMKIVSAPGDIESMLKSLTE